MATSPTPSLESLPGANSIGSFGEHNDYLSDSPLTLSGSSPPVSDSAICDDFSSSGATSSLESHHQTNSSASSSASSTSSSGIGGGSSGSGGGPGGGIITGTRCTGCKSKQSDAVAKCIDCVNYLCSNCVTAHQFMHCFDGHSVFRINAFDNTTTTPLNSNCLSDMQTNPISFLMQQQTQPQSQLSKLMMNGFDGQSQSRFSLKDDTITKLAMSSLLNGPPTSNSSNDIITTSSTTTTTSNNTTCSKQTSQYFCTRHKNELLKFFCRTCSVPVCKDCIVIDHPAGLHECEHVQDATPKQIESLLQIVAEVRSKATDMKQIIKNSEHNTARIQVQYHKAQNEINETYQFFRSMLDERKQELFKELESFYNAKNMSHSVLLAKSQEHIEKVLQSCDCVERITKHAGLAETIMLRKLMENKLQSFVQFIQELQSTCELDFVSNYQAIQVGVRNTFGYIRSSADIPTSKQPPIARPTNNILSSGNGSICGSNGSLNAPLSVGSSLLGGSACQSSVLERPYSSVSSNGNGGVLSGQQTPFDSNIISKRFNSANSLGPFVSDVNLQVNPYEKWSNGGSDTVFNGLSDQYTLPIGTASNVGVNGNVNGSTGQNDSMIDLTSKLLSTTIFPPKSQIKRQKMIYHCKFGEFGVMEGQFTEPSGVAVNAQNDIIVADTNNHRIQIFDKEGRYKFLFGECGKRDGQLLYPNRVAVVRNSGDIIVTERSPTHQIQIYNQYGQFVRKFGANILQHPRGVTVDNKGRIIVVECKVMRVIIFDQNGNVLQKFGCSKHLEFPNGVVVNDKQEIFISDNRAHCVKVFNYEGTYLRQIGGEGITNYPIGVGINAAGEILIADNHNNFNLTIFTQDGQLVSALESKVKHAQCFDVALMDDGSVVLASKDYRLYIYRYVQETRKCSIEEFGLHFLNFIRGQTDGFLRGNTSSQCNTPRKKSLTPFAQSSEQAIIPQLDTSNISFPTLSSRDHSQTSKLTITHEGSVNTNRKISTTITPVSTDFTNRTIEENQCDDSLQLKYPKEPRKLNASHEGNFTSISRIEESPSAMSTPNKSFESRFSSSTSTPVSRRQDRSSSGFANRSTPTSFVSSKVNNEKGKSPSALCLADFIVASPTQRRKSGKDTLRNETKSPLESTSKGPKFQEHKKPTRRVVPTPLASTANSFTSPAFRNENNILDISKDEMLLERNTDTIQRERAVLKDQITAITKHFQEESPYQSNLRHTIADKFPSARITESKVDLSSVTSKGILDRFIEIHSALIDLNLTTNILSEISYLLNLLNVDEDVYSEISCALPSEADVQIDANLINKTDNEFYTVLKSLPNCIYFALGVLEKQKHLLALLDVTTLRVVLDNDRLDCLCKQLKEFLGGIYSYKLQLEGVKSNHEASFRIGQNFTNVFYQQENDTRNNFPSDKEFGAFKKQRDMFYTILKIWEMNHLNHTWNFDVELGPKVNSLLAIMNHPINMAHLSKLFTSHLIISSNFSESPSELEIASLNIDKDKLAKLRQRLVAPSDFSADLQFPGNQAFFKDFVMISNSVVFIEQLKIALIAELLEMNGSFYETISLSFTLDGKKLYNEYVVRPETISTMRVLGKFLGLIISKPFSYEGLRNSEVDNKQVELRNMVQPSFDILNILKKSVLERKLLITIPWIVQYLSMLDYITLRLNYYRDVMNLLYEIYLNLNKSTACRQFQMRPTSVFILRCCLGWLFDRPNIFDDFYVYRQNRQQGTESDRELSKELSRIIQKSLEGVKIQEKTVMKKILLDNNAQRLNSSTGENIDVTILKTSFDPLLESVLNVACPFLADFRVAIMPSRTKRTSRTGRYRHVTTKICESSSIKQIEDPQEKLTEAFLHSQTLSVRRTVEFVTERTTSAVIKDFQIEVLIPSKSDAMEKIKNIKSRELKTVAREIFSIFSDAHTQAIQKWNSELEKKIEIRVKMAMDALLPHETHVAVKNACSTIVIRKCKTKVEDWRISNLSGLEFYSKDINYDAEKLIKNMTGKQQLSTVLKIGDLSKALPSNVFEQLQFLLYFTAFRPELVEQNAIFQFCDDLIECIESHILPTATYRLTIAMTIYLVQNMIERHHELVTDDFIKKIIEVWSCDKLKEFVIVAEKEEKPEKVEDVNTKVEKEEEKENKVDTEDCSAKTESTDVTQDSVLGGLITDIFIQSLGNKRECYERLTLFLVRLINAELVTVNYLNEQFIALFREDWPEDIFKEISLVLDNISKTTTSQHPEDEAKSHLFMEMLADFARDIDEF